jgi:pyruvate/2-oxoglutarate dehydrogenase complex dihydrolipoamide acyltransferase (E2) component
MAVALENGGLLAPVITDADGKSIVEIAREAVKMAEQVRSRRFDIDILKGGTFTVTNAGMYGTDFVTPLVTGAQCAALGIGRLMEKPVVRDGAIVIGTTMGLSLTYDHRIVAGATAAQYFQTVQDLIEHPAELDLKI